VKERAALHHRLIRGDIASLSVGSRADFLEPQMSRTVPMNRGLTVAGGQGVLVGRDGALRRPRSALAGRNGLCVKERGGLGGLRDF